MSKNAPKISRFPVTGNLADEDAQEMRLLLESGLHPLYVWGNAAGFDDDEILSLTRCAKSSYLRFPAPVSMPPNTERLLDYLEHIGVHPSYVMNAGDHEYDGYPAPLNIVRVLAEVVRHDRFSNEDRAEAINALSVEQRKFEEFEERVGVFEDVEQAWEDRELSACSVLRVKTKNAVPQTPRLSECFENSDDYQLWFAELLADQKLDYYEEFLKIRWSVFSESVEDADIRIDDSYRTVSDVIESLFGGDDERNDEIEDALFQYAFQFSKQHKLPRYDAWGCVAEALQNSKSEISSLLSPVAKHSSAMVNGHIIKWPETVELMCEAYSQYDLANSDKAFYESERDSFKESLDGFRSWRKDCEASGELALYTTAQIIQALDVDVVRDSISQSIRPPAQKRRLGRN